MMAPNDGVAWVTGASTGIGRALAMRLARDGWTVVGSARSQDKLQELEQQTAGRYGRILAAPCDVTDRDQVHGTVAAIEQMHGPITLAILNAGTYKADSAEQFSASAFHNTVSTNLIGAAHCLEALLPRWIDRRRGHLAVVSSVAGYRGLPTALGYGATKAALINLCEGLRFDFDRLGLKVQVINPGFVRTPLTDRNPFPMPFIIEAEDAANRIVKGLAGNAFEITFPKRFTFMMKQLRCMPYWLYFPLVRRVTGK